MKRFEKALIVISIFFLLVLLFQFFYCRYVVWGAEITSLSENTTEDEQPQQEEIAIEVIREDDQEVQGVSENAITEADSSGGDPNDSVSDTSPLGDNAEVLDALKEINTGLIVVIAILSLMVGCIIGFEVIKWVRSW